MRSSCVLDGDIGLEQSPSSSMIYFDNQATTPLDPRVFEAMKPALVGHAFGNPSSTHSLGVLASRLLEEARNGLSSLCPPYPRQVVFTSGATEANALSVLGAAPRGKRRHVVISGIEHPSVLECAKELEHRGCHLTVVRPDDQGMLCVDEVVDAVAEQTALLAVMLVNNEVGVLQPAGEICQRVRMKWPLCHLHVDAVQAVGMVDLSGLEAASSISISAHKIHGPRGIGALLLRQNTKLRPLWYGGGQERGMRAGTENVAGAIGLARAAELSIENWQGRAARMVALRDELVDELVQAIEHTRLIGHPKHRSPANAAIAFAGITGDALMGALEQKGIIVSTGAACHSGRSRPSHVLLAMGLRDPGGIVRFGLSRLTTQEEVRAVIAATTDAVTQLRSR